MSSRATKKQQELLQFIDNFIKGNGYGPSYREVMRGLDYKSVSTVAVHIDGLIAKGYIRKKDHSARSIEIVSMQQPTPQVSAAQIAGLTWLESEINSRLVAGESAADTAKLVEAAKILGLDDAKVEAFSKQLAASETDRLTEA